MTMTASLCWSPVEKNSRMLSALAPSQTMEILAEIGISFPGEAGIEHLAALHALAKAWPNQKQNPFRDLVEAIEKHDRVKLWAEY